MASEYETADRVEAAWKRERSQAKTASAYEYAVQEKFKGKWHVDLNGFSSLDEAEDYMNTMCEMNPGYEFRVVRRKTTDWEVVE